MITWPGRGGTSEIQSMTDPKPSNADLSESNSKNTLKRLDAALQHLEINEHSDGGAQDTSPSRKACEHHRSTKMLAKGNGFHAIPCLEP